MKANELLDAIEYIAPALIEKAEFQEGRQCRKNLKAIILRYGAAAASLVIIIGAILCVPYLDGQHPIIPDTTQVTGTNMVPNQTLPVESDAPILVDPPEVLDAAAYQEDFNSIHNALKESGAMGGGSFLFNRKYQDETYNIAYLRMVYRGEISILPEGALDKWVSEVYLKQSPSEQDELPTIYQAIRDLNIKKEDLIALNECRKTLSKDNGMILEDWFIDALYYDEAEMKQALVNPLALYHADEIYTWEELKTMTLEAAIANGISGDALKEYMNYVVEYCVENNIIPKNAISRYFSEGTKN